MEVVNIANWLSWLLDVSLISNEDIQRDFSRETEAGVKS